MLDYNGDGWPDLFVANDTQPNKLYRNNKNGTFTEEGMAAGVAFGEDGVARGAMGADCRRLRPLRPRRICWWATSPTRCSACITTKATACSWTKRRPPPWAAPACSRSPSASSSSTTIWTAIPTSSPPTATSKRRSGAFSRRVQYQEPPLLFRNLGKRQVRERVGARWARLQPRRWWRAARPMPISITTATSTC